MKMRVISLVVATGCLVSAVIADEDRAKKISEMLQGKWSVMSIELNGQTIASDEIKNWKLTITNNTYTITIGQSTEEGTFKIDTSKKPMTVDAFPTSGDASGQKRIGIFEIDGDKAKVCFSAANLEVRPTKFTAEEGSQQFNWTFKKE